MLFLLTSYLGSNIFSYNYLISLGCDHSNLRIHTIGDGNRSIYSLRYYCHGIQDPLHSAVTEDNKIRMCSDNDNSWDCSENSFECSNSCLEYDPMLDNLSIKTGAVGSSPIWYSFDDTTNHFIVTNDYVMGLKYMSQFPANLEFSTVPPCYEVNFSLSNFSVTHWNPWCVNYHEFDVSKIKHLSSDWNIANELLGIYETALIRSNLTMIDSLAELDLLDSNSMLLDVSIAHVLSKYSRRDRAIAYLVPPLVEGSGMYEIEKLSFIQLLTDGVSANPLFIQANIFVPRFESMVSSRYDICKTAKDLNKTAVIMFDNGFWTATDYRYHDRAIKIFLTKLICGYLGVKVVFPFASEAVQRFLWKLSAANGGGPMFSYLNGAIDVLTGILSEQLDDTRKKLYFREKSYKPFQGPANKLLPYKEVSVHSSVEHKAVSSSDPSLVIVVFATSGYFGVLYNFFSHVKLISDEEDFFKLKNLANKAGIIVEDDEIARLKLDLSSFLVVTSDYDIVKLAKQFGAQYYLFCDNAELSRNCTHENHTLWGRKYELKNELYSTLRTSDFGTADYQKLMLVRTSVVYQLLQIGFNVLLSDIDVVWVENPVISVSLSIARYKYLNSIARINLSSSRTLKNDHFPLLEYDVAVTDDWGEVCGCFLILKANERVLRFWETVLNQHKEIVSGFNHASMTDSEQKVLTRLLFHGEYFRVSNNSLDFDRLSVFVLPKNKFPNGYFYFNRKDLYLNSFATCEDSGPFDNNTNSLRIGLPLSASHYLSVSEVEQTMSHMDIRNDMSDIESSCMSSVLFHDLFLVKQPTIIHNNFLVGDAIKRARLSYYGYWIDEDEAVVSPALSHRMCGGQYWNMFSDVRCDWDLPNIMLVLPSHNMLLNDSKIVILVTTEGLSNDIQPLLCLESDQNSCLPFKHFFYFGAVMSATNNISPFTVVLNQISGSVSIDVVVPPRSHYNVDYAGGGVYGASDEKYRAIVSQKAMLRTWDVQSNKNMSNCSDLHTLQFDVKVLTFNRPLSLLRLLNSLNDAFYSCGSSKSDNYYIPLEILIDCENVNENCVADDETVRVATEFKWKNGYKTVTVRAKHHGLAGQWLNSFSPANATHLAYIFEDDMEVSPHYFQWSCTAAHKAYCVNDHTDTEYYFHKKLLKAVRNHVAANGEAVVDYWCPSPYTSTVCNNKLLKLTHLQVFAIETAGFPLIYGICMQKQHLDPMHYPKRFKIRNSDHPFLYSLIGSWGPLLLPLPWKAFLEYSNWIKLEDISIENTVINFFKENNPRIWTPFHVRFAYDTGSKCLFSNFPSSYALVVNHREAGQNYHKTLGNPLSVASLIPAVLPDSFIGSINGRLRNSFSYHDNIEHLAMWSFDLNGRRVGSIGSDRIIPLNISLRLARAPYTKKNLVNAADLVLNSLYYSCNIGVERLDILICEDIRAHFSDPDKLSPQSINAVSLWAEVINTLDSLGNEDNWGYVYLGNHDNHSTPLYYMLKESRKLDRLSDVINLNSLSYLTVVVNAKQMIDNAFCEQNLKSELAVSYKMPSYVVVEGFCMNVPTEIRISLSVILESIPHSIMERIIGSPSGCEVVSYSFITSFCLDSKGVSIFKLSALLDDEWHHELGLRGLLSDNYSWQSNRIFFTRQMDGMIERRLDVVYPQDLYV